jgi:hypothetical protein
MISRKKIILIYLSFPFVHEGCKQEPNEIPKEFVERKISTNRGGESNLELFYEDGFRVNIEKNKLVVQTVQENHKCMLEIPNGSLEGIDGGEWGGELSFVPNGVNTKRIKIKAGNIKSIFSFKNKVYFIQGLHHMGYSEGALYELVVKDSIFTYVDKLKFER